MTSRGRTIKKSFIISCAGRRWNIVGCLKGLLTKNNHYELDYTQKSNCNYFLLQLSIYCSHFHCRYNGRYKVVLFQHNRSKEYYWKNDNPHFNSQKFVRFGYITCKDGDSDDGERLSYAKQASESSHLIINRATVIHVEHVQPYKFRQYLPSAADPNSILIGFTKQQDDLLLKWDRRSRGDYRFQEYVNVQFGLKHSYFERLHEPISRLSQEMVNKIMPHEGDISYSNSHLCDDIKVYPPMYERLELDKTCQFQALRMILSSNSHCPLLIAGPFGTGKTRLLARAAFELLRDRNNKVLICAHHQASVDMFVEYFGSIKKDSDRPWQKSFVRVAPDNNRSSIKDKYPEFFTSVFRVNKKIRQSFQLVITTLGLAPFLEQSRYGDGYFTHILIDEGAQTREPETVGPLCLAGMNTKIIIAGDHYQVHIHNSFWLSM